jgi:hypothetical protein
MASNLTLARERLEQFNYDLENWIKENSGAGLEDILKMYFQVKEAYELLTDNQKATGALLERMSRGLIPDLMDTKDTKTISIASIGRRFTVSAKLSASIIDKPGAYGWLRDPKQDAADLIQETVNASTLASFAKSYVNEQGKDLPEAYFRVNTMRYTSVTKI